MLYIRQCVLTVRGLAPSTLLALFMSLRLVLLHHSASSHFRCPVAVATTLLGRLLDMFVLALFFVAHAAQWLFLWHKIHLLYAQNYILALRRKPGTCAATNRARFPRKQRHYNVQIRTRFQQPKGLGFRNLSGIGSPGDCFPRKTMACAAHRL